MGDFNARPESDEIRWLCGLTTLDGRRTHVPGRLGAPAPGRAGLDLGVGQPLHHARWASCEPDRRLDYIFVTPERRDGRGRILDCRIVFDKPDAGGVFASDHFGVFAEVQIVADPVAAPAVT